MNAVELQKAAKRKAANLRRKKRDPRYVKVIGRLVQIGLLDTNDAAIEPNREILMVDECLWVGKIEPRVLELLPALLLKKPGVFEDATALPDDLYELLLAIRRGDASDEFRGVPASGYLKWLPLIGWKGKRPSVTKSFRFSAEDQEMLASLRAKTNAKSDIAVLRQALLLLEEKTKATA